MNKGQWKKLYRKWRLIRNKVHSIISNDKQLEPASPEYQKRLLMERGFNSIEEFKQYYRENETKQEHYIRNHNAPVEQDRYSFIPTAQQSLKLPSGKYFRVKPSENLIGLYYARHEPEFWKYHDYNEFNRKWLKEYVDILNRIKHK